MVGGPASTLALAGDLARLMDDMVTRGVDWDALDGLVPDQFDKYWQHTLEFLRIARKTSGRSISKEIGRIEPAARRDLLIEAEAARLTAHHDGPVIAAGSTGSMPATAKFLHAVAGLPQGAVVLPGLDTDLDDEAWQIDRRRQGRAGQIHHAALLQPSAIRDARAAAIASASSAATSKSSARRRRMDARCWCPRRCGRRTRPRNGTTGWRSRISRAKIAGGMTKLAVIEAPNPEMEALAIAVAMREARHLDKSAALVTPDRALARRVMAALGRWNLEFDDSGGDALMDTPAGIFARLAAEAAGKGLEPPTLAGAAETSAVPARRRAWRVQARHRDARTGAAARHAAASRAAAGLARDFDRFRDELAKLSSQETSSLHALRAARETAGRRTRRRRRR